MIRNYVKIKYLVGAFCFLSIAFWAVNALGKNNEHKKISWELVWEENFDRDSIDNTVWNYRKRGGSGGTMYVSQNPDCYVIDKGVLKLRSIKNPDLSSDTAKFLCAGLDTSRKKSFQGKLEIRARFNLVSGGYQSIWLMPFSPKHPWPLDGEIDIMEHSGVRDYITQTVHSGYTRKHPNTPKYYEKVRVNTRKYNVYGVEILENEIIFYVNNKKTFSYPRMPGLRRDDQFPFYREWYLILNDPLGINGAGPIDESGLPSTLEIDWIRYYEAR